MITALALAAAASQTVYPAEQVVREVQSVCYDSGRPNGGSYGQLVDHWEQAAKANGWTPITQPIKALSNSDASAVGRIGSLNHLLYGGYALVNGRSHLRTDFLGGQVFRKQVADRTLYLSLFGADDDSFAMVECRVHDLMLDQKWKNPIGPSVIERVFGAKPKKRRGPFNSAQYSLFTPGGGKQYVEISVHYGFGGWHASPEYPYKTVDIDNPYAPYGLTIVAGKYDAAIIVAG